MKTNDTNLYANLPLFPRELFGGGINHTYSVEASTLLLPPGSFPTAFTAPGLGNGQPFIMRRANEDGGYLYEQRFGIVRVNIIND